MVLRGNPFIGLWSGWPAAIRPKETGVYIEEDLLGCQTGIGGRNIKYFCRQYPISDTDTA
jgi:hypothetical protein